MAPFLSPGRGERRWGVLIAASAWINIPDNPLIPLDLDRNFVAISSHPLSLNDTWPIALAGTLVRTGDQGRAAAPDRSRFGSAAG